MGGRLSKIQEIAKQRLAKMPSEQIGLPEQAQSTVGSEHDPYYSEPIDVSDEPYKSVTTGDLPIIGGITKSIERFGRLPSMRKDPETGRYENLQDIADWAGTGASLAMGASSGGGGGMGAGFRWYSKEARALADKAKQAAYARDKHYEQTMQGRGTEQYDKLAEEASRLRQQYKDSVLVTPPRSAFKEPSIVRFSKELDADFDAGLISNAERERIFRQYMEWHRAYVRGGK